MKLFIKYSKDPPYLPEAVADSKSELAEMIGTTPGTVYSSYSHGRKTFAEVDIDNADGERTLSGKLERDSFQDKRKCRLEV